METTQPTHRYAVALTIAGSDSSGGAGIQADLKTFAAHGVFGTNAITALTAQNTLGVSHIEVASPLSIRLQIDATVSDLRPAAFKSGMLFDSKTMDEVAQAIKRHALTNYILDPVMISTSGVSLMETEARQTLLTRLIPLATLITPNLHEASYMIGVMIDSRTAMENAAKALSQRYATQSILIKGGHLSGETMAYDLLYHCGEPIWLEAPLIATRNTHGTGCTLSAAITARLALGYALPDAVAAAKRYLNDAIAQGSHLAAGEGHGAVNHLYAPVAQHQIPLDA